MPFELAKPLKVALGTIRAPKFRIFDVLGGTFVIASATFELRRKSNDDLIDSGGTTIDNADIDPAGVAVQTILVNAIDFGSTDIDPGKYWLALKFILTDGTTDEGRQLIEVRDYKRTSD
jgi:hypothetical protein